MPLNPAELALFNALEQQPANAPQKAPEDVTIDEFRSGLAMINEHTGPMADVVVQNIEIPVRNSANIQARIFNADVDVKKAAIFFLPGTGYILDVFDINAIACSRIAQYLEHKVIQIDYRLAPENPLPTSIYDCYDVIKYMAEHASQFNIDSSSLIIAGLSSGANCAAVIAELAQQSKEFNISHLILLNGYYDATYSQHEYQHYANQDKLCSSHALKANFNLLNIPDLEKKQPIYSPLYLNHYQDFPQTSIIVAEYDGLRSESEAYYLHLKKHNVPVTKEILYGQTHNTMIMRKTMHEGKDPALAIAEAVKRHLAQSKKFSDSLKIFNQDRLNFEPHPT